MIETVLSGVAKAQRKSDYWIGLCPAHDDHKHSLSISERGGKVLVKCHAGCSQDAIIEALKARQAWPESEKPIKVADYLYHNADGTPAYRMERYSNKQFVVRSLGGEAGLKGAKPVPYQLHKFEGKKAIVFVEGEKDVHTVEKMGLVGTTTPFGASSWRSHFKEHFDQKRVAIIPDNDEPGEAYADAVAKDLCTVAESVKIVRLPGVIARGDLSDWFVKYEEEPEKGRAELIKLIQSAVELEGFESSPASGENVELSGVRVDTVERETVTFLWKPYFPKGRVSLLDGDPGVSKSFLSCAIAAGLSVGSRYPVDFGAAGCTLLLSSEDRVGDTIRARLEDMGADLSKVFVVEEPFSLEPKMFEALNRLIKKTEARIVFFDPLVAYLGTNLDMNKANHSRYIMSRLGKLAAENDCAVVGIRHLRKEAGKGGKSLYRGIGSIDFVGAARSVCYVTEDADDSTLKRMDHIKSNVSVRGRTIYYRVQGGTFYWVSDGMGTESEKTVVPTNQEDLRSLDELSDDEFLN